MGIEMTQASLANSPLFEWPKISLSDYKDVDIDFKPAKIFYNVFFDTLFLPVKIGSAFKDVFVSDLSLENSSIEKMGIKIEKELVTIFDKAYSLDEN